MKLESIIITIVGMSVGLLILTLAVQLINDKEGYGVLLASKKVRSEGNLGKLRTVHSLTYLLIAVLGVLWLTFFNLPLWTYFVAFALLLALCFLVCRTSLVK